MKEKASIYVPAIGAVTIAVLLRNLLRIVQNRDESQQEIDTTNGVRINKIDNHPNGVQGNEVKDTPNGIQDKMVVQTRKDTQEAGPIL